MYGRGSGASQLLSLMFPDKINNEKHKKMVEQKAGRQRSAGVAAPDACPSA